MTYIALVFPSAQPAAPGDQSQDPVQLFKVYYMPHFLSRVSSFMFLSSAQRCAGEWRPLVVPLRHYN